MNKNLSKEQYNQMEAPTHKGAKLDIASKGIDRFHKVRVRFSVEEDSVSKS